MRIYAVWFLAMAFVGCGEPAQDDVTLSSSGVYNRTGVTLAAPDEEGWILAHSNEREIAFEKRDNGGTTTVRATSYEVENFDETEALLNYLEEEKRRELSEYEILSVHFNHMQFKGTSCLQYDGASSKSKRHHRQRLNISKRMGTHAVIPIPRIWWC